MGKQVSLVADLPGTTRDWVAGLVELAGPGGDLADSVAVRWLDTPGLRDSRDPIEQRAIAMARRVVADADVLLAMRDGRSDWPQLPRVADLWLVNKVDDGPAGGNGRSSDDPLAISAATGFALDQLPQRIRRALGLDDTAQPTLWAFTDILRTAVASNDRDALQRYVN
jgi:tRNA modification GTPase